MRTRNIRRCEGEATGSIPKSTANGYIRGKKRLPTETIKTTDGSLDLDLKENRLMRAKIIAKGSPVTNRSVQSKCVVLRCPRNHRIMQHMWQHSSLPYANIAFFFFFFFGHRKGEEDNFNDGEEKNKNSKNENKNGSHRGILNLSHLPNHFVYSSYCLAQTETPQKRL